MNISNEREISAITQTSRISSNEQGNWFKSLKSLVVAIFSVSLALWLIILVIAIIGIIPLTQLIVGSVHKNNCPMNHLIPIYLIVAGVIGLFILIISIIQNCSSDISICLCLQLIFGLFEFGWFIAGCVWVFRAKSIVQFNNPNETSTYCNKTAFNCAYATLIITIIWLILTSCCQCFRTRS